jgi:hypothetical protein
MGQVFRARDAKLHRDVALNVMPEAFAADADCDFMACERMPGGREFVKPIRISQTFFEVRDSRSKLTWG